MESGNHGLASARRPHIDGVALDRSLLGLIVQVSCSLARIGLGPVNLHSDLLLEALQADQAVQLL